MGGFYFDLSCTEESTRPSTGIRDTPTPAAFQYIMQNFPDIIPDISEESITDCVRSSGLSKAILMVQVGWFCFNCASRLIENLPLTLLEVATVAHCFCTLLIYFAWWSKPFNTVMSTPMHGKRAIEVHALLACTPGEYRRALEIAKWEISSDAWPMDYNQDAFTNVSTSKTHDIKLDRVNLAARALKHLLPRPPVHPEGAFLTQSLLDFPGCFRSHEMISVRMRSNVLILTRLFYGLPHFLGWNELFPTSYERLFWVTSTAIIAGSGLLFELGIALLRRVSMFISSKLSFSLEIALAYVIAFAYTIASSFIIIESVRQLFFLPPAAYELTSSSHYWPHFS